MNDVVDYTELLICSPVLNFLQYCIEKGADDATIVKYASELFELAAVKDAKKKYETSLCRVKNESGEKALQIHINDMIENMRFCKDSQVVLPCFVIR